MQVEMQGESSVAVLGRRQQHHFNDGLIGISYGYERFHSQTMNHESLVIWRWKANAVSGRQTHHVKSALFL